MLGFNLSSSIIIRSTSTFTYTVSLNPDLSIRGCDTSQILEFRTKISVFPLLITPADHNRYNGVPMTSVNLEERHELSNRSSGSTTLGCSRISPKLISLAHNNVN